MTEFLPCPQLLPTVFAANLEMIVCWPPKLRGGLFTTAAVGNIDHIPLMSMVHSTEQ